MEIKWWFVSYQYANGKDNGFGNIELELSRPLNARKTLSTVKKYIEDNLKDKGIHNANVVILNFIQLEDE